MTFFSVLRMYVFDGDSPLKIMNKTLANEDWAIFRQIKVGDGEAIEAFYDDL